MRNTKVFKSIHFCQLFSVHEYLGPDIGYAVDQDFTLLNAHFHSISPCSVCQSVSETLQFGVAVALIREAQVVNDSPSYGYSGLKVLKSFLHDVHKNENERFCGKQAALMDTNCCLEIVTHLTVEADITAGGLVQCLDALDETFLYAEIPRYLP